jgi:hypothetical protein
MTRASLHSMSVSTTQTQPTSSLRCCTPVQALLALYCSLATQVATHKHMLCCRLSALPAAVGGLTLPAAMVSCSRQLLAVLQATTCGTARMVGICQCCWVATYPTEKSHA